MKRVGKLAVLGSTVAMTALSPLTAPGPSTVAPRAEKACAGEQGLSRVRAGSRAAEPGARVSTRVAETVERELGRQELTDTLLRATEKDQKWINIPVHFHVLHAGKKGEVTKKRVLKQIEVLDAAYRGRTGGFNTRINFYLKKITWTDQKDWFAKPRQYEADFKKKLRKGGDSTLNIYTADLGTDLLGWATLPWDYEKARILDGVVVHYGSLPGAKINKYNLGYTAVHEVGHWLGLYHTFGRNYPDQDGCEAGDLVGDTPAQSEPTSGCPKKAPDTCTAARGRDPIHNFMDYGYDTCMTEFTKGQSERMRAAWERYRP